MSDWKLKRFWKAADVAQTDSGFAVQLDGRPVRTPAKARLEVPTVALAQEIAREWDAQDGEIDPETMPATKSSNAAIDKVSVQFAEVADMLAAYGDCDLTCYRAPDPQELANRQAAAWNPLLDWAAVRYQARLVPVSGVIHQPQDPESVARLRAPLDKMTPFEMTAMHDLVSLSGSLIIGLAASESHLPVADLWALSRIDEDWQIEQWGADDDANAQADIKRRAFHHAARFLNLTRQGAN